MTKTHIMRWAPQDYRTSRTRARSAASRDPMLRLVYLEALSALYEAGGTLPADPAVLADELLLPARDIARCLPILDEIARSGSGRGGLLIEGGWITNGRVTSDLKVEQQFREEQAERGRRGGEAKAASTRQATATRGSSPPLPVAVAVADSQMPAPDPAPVAGAHPLAPDRPALEAECMRLVREIAALRGVDGTEVMGEAGAWNGRRQLNPASMSIDRLMNTVLDLRKMRGGQPAHAPPTNPRAAERKAGIVALVMGGLNARRGVGGGDERPGGQLPDSGSGPGGPDDSERRLPPGTRDPE